jgi:hypothetical protein
MQIIEFGISLLKDNGGNIKDHSVSLVLEKERFKSFKGFFNS